jgi:hypothetical protein
MFRQISCIDVAQRVQHRRGISFLALAAAVMALTPKTSALVAWTNNINTNNIIVITNATYGAVGDGVTTNTTAIQNAINAAAAGPITNGSLGGTVEIPAGTNAYLCGPITLKNNVNLQIDQGAILRMLSYSQYPGGIIDPQNFISGLGLTNIEISGYGAIDGQGAPWWPGYKTNNRPIMISLDGCNRELIQNVTLSNSPEFHIAISGKAGNTTVQGVTVLAPASTDPVTASHNTDACDVSGTNILVQNCNISTGDDDFACSGGTSGVLVTNNTYGNGHGVSIGSYTDDGGVSNITVTNCTFNGTANGIRIKSDDGRGGLVQNISYYIPGMTNVDFPIQVYSYYNEDGTPSGITPYYAATQAVAEVTSTTPIYRNITFSNITATSVSGYPVGIIWARTEMPATNIVFQKINLTGYGSFCLYNVNGAQFVDSTISLPTGITSFELFNAQVIISNSAPTNTLFTFDGLTTNGYGNSFAIYNADASLQNTNAFGYGPLTLSASTFTVSNNLTLFPTTVVNFMLGTNAACLAVAGNLSLGGTNNICSGGGFTNGTYTVMTYTGTLNGTLPTLGTVPSGYTYAFNTNTAGQVNLVVTSSTTTSVQSSANPSTYGTVVTFTATVSPAPTNGESVIFKDGSTTLGTGTLSGGQATFKTTATQLAAVSHSITAVYAGDGAYGASTSSALTQTVNPLGLTVSGLTISNKVYNRTTAAALNTNGYALNTVIGGDAVTLATNGYTATFASSNVANGISVTVTGLSLSGAQAGNYTLTQPTGLTANITPLGLTVSGLTINNKVYNGTAAATLNTNGYALNTVIGGDVVTLTTNGYTATFASCNVANGISVTVTGLSLGGAQAGNYTLTQPTGLTANITPAGSSILPGSSANPVAHLTAVFFTANVTPSTLSGTVLFLTNGVTFDSETLSGGTATSVSTSVLPRGTNTITTVYSGSSNYATSTNTLSQIVTNNPPTANPAVYYRLVGSSLTIGITGLKTNWNDLDGDVVALAAASASSTNGGTVTYDSTNIYYSNSNNVTDQIGYTISDGHGGTANGIITVLLAQQEISVNKVNPDGSVSLDFTGIPGAGYWVEAATNLTPPMNWTMLSTNIADTNGLWQFTDAQATNFLQRYYRTQQSH